MIIVKFVYLKPIEIVDKFREQHLDFLNKLASEKKVLFGGRILDKSGGIAIFDLNNKDEVKEILKNEPYFLNQVANHEITEFGLKIIAEDFKKLLNNN